MSTSQALLALSLVTVASAHMQYELENGVLMLGGPSLDEAAQQFRVVLVMFYAPWCPQCKKILPEFEAAAQQLLREDIETIKLAKVDGTKEDNKMMGQRFAIKSYPTFKIFRNGQEREYQGPKDKADAIVPYLKKKLGPAYIEINSVAEAEQLTMENYVVVMGFFETKKTHDGREYLKAADDNEFEHIPYVWTSNKEVWEKFDVKSDGILMLKHFDEPKIEYMGEKWAIDISAWVKQEAIPLVAEFNKDTAEVIFKADIKVHFLLVLSKAQDNFEKMLKAVRPSAKANKGKMIFLYLDTDVEANTFLLEYLGLDADESPFMMIYRTSDNAKFVSKTDVTLRSVEAFVERYWAGSTRRHLRGEDVPENWDAEPVKVLVTKNFKEVAMDSEKHVFVEFYAPWCSHCKALEPKWLELAEYFSDQGDVVIAKMDATANEIEETQVKGFPTLKLFARDTNEIIEYKGKRELDEMIDFIETGEQIELDMEELEEDEEEEDEDYEGEEEEIDEEEEDVLKAHTEF